MDDRLDGEAARVVSDWFDLCHRAGIGLVAATAMGETLATAYRAPHRVYHTLAHVGACLRLLDRAGLDGAERVDAELAVWFHDAVYDPTRGDNETRSADLARGWLAAQGRDPAPVVEAVEATATHRVDPGDPLVVRAVHDVDLAVLGAPEPDYDGYVAAIRREYAHVADDAFRRGRAAVLRSLAGLEPLYALPTFAAALGPRATANLARELASLEAAGDAPPG